jgi:hypothetical protein
MYALGSKGLLQTRALWLIKEILVVFAFVFGKEVDRYHESLHSLAATRSINAAMSATVGDVLR